MNFSNKFVQTIVSFFSTKFVLCNGIIDWNVWLVNNHQLITKVVLNKPIFQTLTRFPKSVSKYPCYSFKISLTI